MGYNVMRLQHNTAKERPAMSAKKRVRKRRLYKATALVTLFAVLFVTSGLANIGFVFADDEITLPVGGEEYTITTETNEEVTQYRGEYEKHFLNTDGTVTAYSYANPIHYLDSDGNWQDIDNTLVKSTEGFVNKANPNEMKLSSVARDNNLVSVELEGYEVSWGIQGINNVQGYEAEKQEATDRRDLTHLTSKVKYDNVFENTSLVYTLSSYSLSEDLIFDSLPNFDQVTYQIQTTNLIAQLEGSEVVFTSTTEEGKEIFRFQAPYLCDSAFKLTYDITVILNATEGGYTLTYILDRQWLQSEERVYPITLDPTLTSYQHYSNVQDTYTCSWYPDTNFVNELYLCVGLVHGESYTFVKINTMPSIPLGAPIVDARLELVHSIGTSTWGYLEILEIQTPWSSSVLTWNNQSSYIYPVNLAYNIEPSWNGSLGAYAYSIYVASTVAKWYNGTMENNGFLLWYQNHSYNDYNTLYSSDHGSIGSSYLPAISVTYDIVPLTPTFVGNLLWPVSNVYYYISPITKAYYNAEILAAITDWENAVNTSCGYTKLHLTEVYTPGLGYATVEIYIDNSPTAGVGYVCMYDCNGDEVEPWLSDWAYCKMWLNMYYLPGYTSEEAQAVIAHEFGHVWGLDHNWENDDGQVNELCKYSIMYPDTSMYARKVSGVDLDAFNQKHP